MEMEDDGSTGQQHSKIKISRHTRLVACHFFLNLIFKVPHLRRWSIFDCDFANVDTLYICIYFLGAYNIVIILNLTEFSI